MNLNVLDKVKIRQEDLVITLEDIAMILNIPTIEVKKFFNGEYVATDTKENITGLLGLDTLGNELVTIQTLKEKRADERALYVVSLVQDTMSLEMQGLEPKTIIDLIQETKGQLLTGEYQDKLWKT